MDHAHAVINDELSLRCKIVLISFVRNGAETWQQTAGIEPERRALLLVDEEREVYRKFGLERGSTLSIWHPKVIWYYFVRKLSGGELHDINGDPNQLGGDFLFSKDGRLLLSHPSQGPTDRVSVDEIRCHLE